MIVRLRQRSSGKRTRTLRRRSKSRSNEIKVRTAHGLNRVDSKHLIDTNRTRLVRKAQPTDSFFNFFTPPQPPSEDPTDENILDEEEFEELEASMQVDFQIGEDFKDKVRSTQSVEGAELMLEKNEDNSACCGVLHRQGITMGRR